MIIELAIGAGVVAAGVLAARLLRRKREPEKRLPPPPPEREAPTRKGGLKVGDVLLYADSELWLAGVVALDEEGPVCRLFRTPGAKHATWLVELDEEGKEVALLRETDQVPAGPVPERLPIDGIRLALRKRGDADVTSAGEQLPTVEKKARYAILQGPGGKLLVVVDFEREDRLALAGERVGTEMFDLLPGG